MLGNGVVTLSDYALEFLNICIMPFQMVDNCIVVIPLAFMCVLGAVGIFSRLMK